MDAKKRYIEGLSLLAKDDLSGAVAAFRDSVALDDQFGLGYLGLAQALDRQGVVDEAIKVVQQAIVLMPEDPLPHTSLSRLYQQKDLIEEAEEEMAESMRLQRAKES
ncbi:TPA: hypothetical protein DCE37_05615 [Candidatus Latescibacteria bacterium]|nr:hypothetical protein [Gemmatimonadota bacterium]HAA74579.1 hypothetical protein [Candidatus Latescibacterota bacterium]